MTAVLPELSTLAELRGLGPDELVALAADIRAELIGSVTSTGGHLGPNLGVVELTLAVHRVFHSPHDAIVFDTGHQSYVHKMLTGRWDALAGLRQPGGMSGYPSRAESEHDLVENSHASTALSHADGLATAFALRAQHDRCVVAVVGDGALTGGMSWEALNNLGAARGRPVIIVLNDNGRSYAPTVGGLAEHLAQLRGGQAPNLFQSLGLGYLGPVDGHDVGAIEAALTQARQAHTPTVVHCRTQKGHVQGDGVVHDLAGALRRGAAGVVADHAAEGAVVVRRRFGAELQTVLGELRVEHVQDDARLHPAGPRCRVDREHPIAVLGEVDDHCGVGALPCQTGATAAGQHRGIVFAAHG